MQRKQYLEKLNKRATKLKSVTDNMSLNFDIKIKAMKELIEVDNEITAITIDLINDGINVEPNISMIHEDGTMQQIENHNTRQNMILFMNGNIK